ncbi:hypothetical protein L1D52_04135 [Vibrio brasiliensis]|uniref:hypothetical protein n=1 Tax=Vibrio brasiliensis TaxID=170652 RepID=UPI001EFE4B23|nr:hypothetical protein [Vibrio brasiliensis]MCG9781530.1 hypothetical protein [Vibrio brasiliensis]
MDLKLTWKGTIPPPQSSLNSPTNMENQNHVPDIPKQFEAHPQMSIATKLNDAKLEYISVLQLNM